MKGSADTYDWPEDVRAEADRNITMTHAAARWSTTLPPIWSFGADKSEFVLKAEISRESSGICAVLLGMKDEAFTHFVVAVGKREHFPR
jgi:hypothetical protein